MKNSEFENGGEKPSRGLQLIPLEKAAGGTCNAYTTRLFGKKVFVKEIKPEFADDPRMLAAFKKEAEIGFRLDHRNLPGYVYTEGVLPPEKYIVQEFIDGHTLPDIIKKNPTYFENRENVVRLIRELADVVDYLHRNQIVHLDLKPENIIISRIGNSLKLVDLGFCASDFYDDTRGFTRGALAPEGSLRPEERGTESDYYGLGNTLAYIRVNTPRFPKAGFRKLENRLLDPEPSSRISSKEEIERLLRRKGGKNIRWTVVLTLIAVLALAAWLFIPSGSDLREPPAEEVVAPPAFPEIPLQDPVDNEAEISPNVEYRRPEIQPDETVNNFPFKPYEALKAEIAEEINKDFADFQKLVQTYISEENYSEADFAAIREAYENGMAGLFKTDPYKAKYFDLSPSLIDDTIAEMVEEAEKKRWRPEFEKYANLSREYQSRSEGDSR